MSLYAVLPQILNCLTKQTHARERTQTLEFTAPVIQQLSTSIIYINLYCYLLLLHHIASSQGIMHSLCRPARSKISTSARWWILSPSIEYAAQSKIPSYENMSVEFYTHTHTQSIIWYDDNSTRDTTIIYTCAKRPNKLKSLSNAHQITIQANKITHKEWHQRDDECVPIQYRWKNKKKLFDDETRATTTTITHKRKTPN